MLCLVLQVLTVLYVVGIEAKEDTITFKDSPKHVSFSGKKQSCRSLVESGGWRQRVWRQWNKRHRKPIFAYRMAIVSTLSYWEYGKRPLPMDVTGFSLSLDGSNDNLFNGSRRLFHAAKKLPEIIEKASLTSPAATLLVRNCTNVTGNSSNNSPCNKLSTYSSFDKATTATNTTSTTTTHRKQQQSSKHITFQYYLFDWHEKGVAGVRFHDTDVLLSTMGDGSLVIAFAGTASAADAVTNLQTFEPTNHSGFYPNVQGSLHRGFLNALTRVDRGSILRLCLDCRQNIPSYLDKFDKLFGTCTKGFDRPTTPNKKKETVTTPSETSNNLDGSKSNLFGGDNIQIAQRRTGNGAESMLEQLTSTNITSSFTIQPRRKKGCKVRGKGLLSILEEIVIQALQQGRAVHMAGHSLGGGLASHLALDLVLNFPTISVRRLHLWTFGAPQIVDSVFLTSALTIAPRLGDFISGRNAHRFVTVSDHCRPDVVSEVTKNSLPSHKPKGLHGKVARTLGGVHGPIVHFTAEPHYLLTPRQYHNDTIAHNHSKTTSTVAAHSTVNYLQGISRESRHHPLQTDLPEVLQLWLGEVNN